MIDKTIKFMKINHNFQFYLINLISFFFIVYLNFHVFSCPFLFAVFYLFHFAEYGLFFDWWCGLCCLIKWSLWWHKEGAESYFRHELDKGCHGNRKLTFVHLNRYCRRSRWGNRRLSNEKEMYVIFTQVRAHWNKLRFSFYRAKMEFETTETAPSTSRRYEKSLGLLTRKFVSLLQEAKDGVLDLKVVSETTRAGSPMFSDCLFVFSGGTIQAVDVNKGLSVTNGASQVHWFVFQVVLSAISQAFSFFSPTTQTHKQ